MQAMPKIAVLGAGKMGSTLISALLDSNLLHPEKIVATVKHSKNISDVSRRFGIMVSRNNCDAVKKSNVILICVKPQILKEVVREIASVIQDRHLLVSTVASATTEFIEKQLDSKIPVVRAMPNTPSLVRAGMTVLCAGKHTNKDHLSQAEAIFNAVGRTLILEEKYMDAVTALSASGPAYIYVVLESLIEGGVKVGLPRNIATELATQMCLGASKMVLETKEHPALLKDSVTTPAGCTIDGLLKLEEGGLRVTLIKAVVEATNRASQLIP